jgi:hypothetical protein
LKFLSLPDVLCKTAHNCVGTRAAIDVFAEANISHS